MFLILIISSSSSKEGEVSKLGLGELFSFNNNHSGKKSKQHTESFLNLDDCIYPNYYYESLHSHLVSLPNSNKNNNNFRSSTQED